MLGNTLLHYKLEEKLGEGGMGMVFKAVDTKLDRTVAIKFLSKFVAENSEQKERFILEAKSAAALNHPNIATIHAIEDDASSQPEPLSFIVMEYIDGHELKDVISSGHLPVEECLSISLQIAKGLQAAHRRGIIHRDIKSSNVMINKDGHIKIMDFGLAKILDGAMITKTGTLLGTVAYMSPEQAQETGADHRSDIWSFGVMLYEMICGKRPFTGAYEHSIIYSIINDEHEPVSSFTGNLPDGLERLINKSLEKEPDNRYQNFDDIIFDLNEIMRLASGHSISKSSLISKTVNSSSEKGPKSIEKSEGEKRNLTALVCRFETSALDEDEVDLEDISELLPACFEVATKVIQRYDGYVYNSSAIDLTIVFGYPKAYEDAAKRGVLTALGILEGLRSLNHSAEKTKGINISAKFTLDTGLVMIKASSSKSKGGGIDIVGDSPLTAAKLQDDTSANTIVISDSTFKLVEGYFECKELGNFDLKSRSKSIKLYQILHQSQARSRLEASLISALTPLTGRRKEFDLLTSLWENTSESIGQVIILQGEAGIGKSRLVQEIKKHVAANPQSWLIECFCSPYYQSSSLQPIIELFERNILEFEKGLSSEGKIKKVEGFLVQYGFSLPETVPLFCSLLSIQPSGNYQPLSLTPEAQKQKIIELLINLLLKRAEEQPILFILDDLQWADPTTLELLGHIIEHIQTSQVLLFLTSRPNFKDPWSTTGTHITKMSLNRLPHKEIDRMVFEISGGKEFPSEVMNEIKTKTDGVPLFVEELTKMVMNSDLLIEDGNGYKLKDELKPLQIPATLKDSLMARLDKMGSAKEIAQLGATIGREFSFDLIKALSGLEDSKLQKHLSELVKAEILFRKGLFGEEKFIFKHALVQDTAYQSLLKKQRQEIHKKITATLTDSFSSLVETQPELLAYHYTAAGINDQAINHWMKAGLNSFQRSANKEAVVHLKNGISLLSKIDDENVRNRYELMLLSVLGPASIALMGFGAEEIGKIFSRSADLCKLIGETPQLFPSIWGQWVYNLVRSNLSVAEKLSGEMIELGEKYDDSSMLIEGYWTHGDNLFWLGNLNESKVYLEKAINLYDAEKHHKNAYLYGQDPGIAARCYLSYTNWYLGLPDKALQNTEDALKIAEQLNHPFSIGWALAFKMMIAGFRRDPQLTFDTSKATIEYCTKQAYPFWITSSQIMHGWATALLGELNDGLKIMEEGLKGFAFIGSIAVYPLFQGLLAEVQTKAGLFDEALKNIDEAIISAKANNEIASEIDLYRIKGNTLYSKSTANFDEAKKHISKSLEMSEKLNAKSRRLQAAISMAELLITENNKDAANSLLKHITAEFSEGFETVDYRKAVKLMSV